MASQKLVRCEIRRRGSSGPTSPRFIPLEIFGLWEYLMSTRHDFEVIRPRASLWLDMEDSPESAYNENQYERVTEVTAFVYSGRDEMFTRCCRYFPSIESGAQPSMDELVTMKSDDWEGSAIWQGEAELMFHDSPTEELVRIAEDRWRRG